MSSTCEEAPVSSVRAVSVTLIELCVPVELPDGDNDTEDCGLHGRRNWLIISPIRKQSEASCTEDVARSVLMVLVEKISPSICNRSIF